MPARKDKPMDERGERIITEATAIFWMYGIRSVTMDDMAARLGVSKKTLYLYVKDKNDLVGRVVDRVIGDFTRCTTCGPKDGNAIDELYAITSTVADKLRSLHPAIHFDLEKYHPEAYRRMMDVRRKQVYASAAANLERGITEGLYRDDLNIPIIATLYVSRFEVVFSGQLFPADRFNSDRLHWEIFRYHVRGIASAKGVKYLTGKVKKEQNP